MRFLLSSPTVFVFPLFAFPFVSSVISFFCRCEGDGSNVEVPR